MPRAVSTSLAVRSDAASAQRSLTMLIMVSAVGLGLMALAGCNTIEGAGQDMSAAGRAVTDTAKETKKAM